MKTIDELLSEGWVIVSREGLEQALLEEGYDTGRMAVEDILMEKGIEFRDLREFVDRNTGSSMYTYKGSDGKDWHEGILLHNSVRMSDDAFHHAISSMTGAKTEEQLEAENNPDAAPAPESQPKKSAESGKEAEDAAVLAVVHGEKKSNGSYGPSGSEILQSEEAAAKKRKENAAKEAEIRKRRNEYYGDMEKYPGADPDRIAKNHGFTGKDDPNLISHR
jgi:hypothetical protein